jgi:tetratricopeptide (TPR) repeat protein
MATLTDTLRLILDLPQRRPAASMPRILDALFARLAAVPPLPDVQMVEDEIWDVWTQHSDPAVDAEMNKAIARLAARDYGPAESLFDALVTGHPDWAEAWNKRATLYFLMGRHADSIADIHRTLELEPRHFGALCGFGQIALRAGQQLAARAAFEAALAAHPHLPGIREVIDQLGGGSERTVH